MRSGEILTLVPIWMRELRLGVHDQPANEMQVDADVICPRCLHFIWPDEYVRRTVYGVVQHQACPEDPDAAA
jgi:hypothetical protein